MIALGLKQLKGLDCQWVDLAKWLSFIGESLMPMRLPCLRLRLYQLHLQVLQQCLPQLSHVILSGEQWWAQIFEYSNIRIELAKNNIRELKVEITNWWSNDQFVILNWELVFLGFSNSPIPNPKNTNHQFKITNW